MPWRTPDYDDYFDPYKIMVSEIMLQQTQVARVIPKYTEFIHLFPTVDALASAQLSAVLHAWMGLGYNRRAKFLHQAAIKIMHDFAGQVPSTIALLETLPGVGLNTAGAIAAYSYNQPAIFIETNIRAVFIKHFFNNQTEVHDKQLMPLIASALDTEHPREWYWALMDYGSWIKSTEGNYARYSKHHTVQSAFDGSVRQLRARILRSILEKPRTPPELMKSMSDPRTERVIERLLQEEFIVLYKGKVSIKQST